MLKIWHSRYELHPVTQIGAIASSDPRQGALLKVEWPDGKIGYGDIFPWPELGDVDIDTQLIALSQGRITHLMEQTISLALRDAEFRAEKRNAFQGLPRVKNHFLVNDVSRIDDVVLLSNRCNCGNDVCGYGVVAKQKYLDVDP